MLGRMQFCAKCCRKIYKIKQNRFFYGMFYNWLFFLLFLPKNFKIWLFFGRRSTRHRIRALQGFFWITWFPKTLNLFFSCVGILPAQQQKCLILIFGPCHLTPFEATCAFTFWWYWYSSVHLWWREIMLKRGKAYKCFVQDFGSKSMDLNDFLISRNAFNIRLPLVTLSLGNRFREYINKWQLLLDYG